MSETIERCTEIVGSLRVTPLARCGKRAAWSYPAWLGGTAYRCEDHIQEQIVYLSTRQRAGLTRITEGQPAG